MTPMISLPVKITRRGVLVGAAVTAMGVGGLFAAKWFNVTAKAGQDGTLSAPLAHEAAVAGALTLVDIRRPDEWARTGVGVGAVPINMLDRDFIEQLATQVKGDLNAPIALICARGVRSRGMRARLKQAGFTNIIDVPEGMLGSGAGPGWLKRRLPITKE